MGVEWKGQVMGPPSGFEKSTSEPNANLTSISPDSRDSGLDSAAGTTYLAASGSGEAVRVPGQLPGGGSLFQADFDRQDVDLVITGAEGGKIVVIDYFATAAPGDGAPGDGAPGDLVTFEGHRLPGDLVQSLAGPAAPVQIAQLQVAQLTAALEAPRDIGQVEAVQGAVTATGADGLRVELGVGSSVYQGDILETSSDGAVEITFLDGTSFSLGGDAKMVLDELIYDAASNTGSSLMSMLTGTFVFITGEVAKTGPDAMQVRTPSGTIGIRGTKVGCSLEMTDGVSLCVLLPAADGSVGEFVFSNETGSQTISRAFEAVIANAYNASLNVTEVLPSQLVAIFEGLITGVLETEAPPSVLSSGGTFLEFLTARIGLLQSLDVQGTLEGTELELQLQDPDEPDDPNGVAIAATLQIAEVTVGRPGSASSGQLVLTIPIISATLTSFSITGGGGTLTSMGVEVEVTQDGNTVEGYAGEDLVFQFVLNPETGAYTFFLFQPLDHQDPNKTGSADTIDVSFTIAVNYIDGTTQETQIVASILDAGPTADSVTEVLDEAGLPLDPVVGTLDIIPGADGLQSVGLDGVTVTSGGAVVALFSGGEAVLDPVLVEPNTYQGKTADGDPVYEITFDPETGDYSFTLLAPLDHPEDGADTLTLTFAVAVTDGDGDTVISTIIIHITDDVAAASDDDGGTVAEATAGAVTGNVVGNDDLGADGLGGVLQFVHDGVVYTPDADGVTTIETALGGSFTFDFNTGSYSYTAPDSVDNSSGDPVESFVYTVADGDGDTATATLTIAVSDANGPSAADDTLTIDEAAGDPQDADPFNAFAPILREGNLTDNDESGGDGFGALRITDASYDTQGLGAATESEDADSITFTGSGWTLVIDKLTGDYSFTQTGAIDHDSPSATAVFSYTIQDSDGTTSSATFTITITDDDISAAGDDGGSIQEGSAGTLVGSVFDNDDPGADGFGGVTQFTHSGQTYSLASAAGQPGFVSLVGTVITITTELGGTLTFDFATGDYSYSPPLSVDNSSGDPVESFVYTVADGDGDTAVATLTVTVVDANAPAATPDSLLFSESAGDPGDLGDGSAFTAIVHTGSLTGNDDPGDDGFGTPKITAASYDGQGLGALTQPVDEDANSITFTGSGWTLVIDKLTGDYTFTQTGAIDHEALSGVAEFSYTIQDLDGQTSTSTFTVTITDDGITAANDDGGVIDEGAATSGNLFANDDSGVDGFGAVTQVIHDGVTYTAVGGAIAFTTALGGSFSLDVATGEYSYTAPALDDIDGDGSETFRYTVVDGDGDSAEAVLTIGVDDRPEALDDSNAAVEGEAEVGGDLLVNDAIGDGPGRVTQVSFTTSDATAAAIYMGLESEGIFVTEDSGVFTITVVVAEGGSRSFTTLAGGELTIDSDGSYSYVPPPSGALRDDVTETFTYTVVDGDGDSDTAILTIDVTDVVEPVGALLNTNTNVQDQDLRIVITRSDGEILANEATLRSGTGQESVIELGNGHGDVLFETSYDYAVILKFEGGDGTINVTDFDLIFDLDATDLDDPENVFLSFIEQGNIQLGDQGSGADGVIWQITGDPDDLDGDGEVFELSPAIIYDLDGVALSEGDDNWAGDIVVFDSYKSNTSYSLNLALLPTSDDTTATVDAGAALFDDIEVLDITGSQSGEVNVLTVTAQDIFEITDGYNLLIVLGDNDTLVLADGEAWDSKGTREIAIDGTTETFDVYVADFADFEVTLLVDQDLAVQYETAMA